MSLTIAYSPRYVFDIGDHIFRMAKYARTRELLLEQGVVSPEHFVEPDPVAWADLALVHDPEFLRKAHTGEFRPSELAQLELPWSHEVVEGFRLLAGGTVLACRAALATPPPTDAAFARDAPRRGPAIAANIGGGFHHAFPAHGEGFCLFNDVAVGARVVLRDGLATRVAIVDCDVHQGNGTAFIFEHDPAVLTFSLHQQNNYPTVKPKSTIDIGLPDAIGDLGYLQALESHLPAVLAFRPDLIIYVAGADPYADDQLGGLNLSIEGLRGRDYCVLSAARDANVPVAIVLAGGYARNADDTAVIHAATLAEAARFASA